MKKAVVLFNLGGPDSLQNVRPFLFNLFNDPAIIRVPNPFRLMIAFLISSLRYKKAQGIYKQMGGFSPLLINTQQQADALKESLGQGYSIHICMRYWHPRTDKVIEDLKKEELSELILLPLYPQFSTTTTNSSFKEFIETLQQDSQLSLLPIRTIPSYHTHPLFIKAHVELIQKTINQLDDSKDVVLLFSAHSIPQDLVLAGDPYQKQVEETVETIMESFKAFDYKLCYQSKVGPKKWLEPATDATIEAYSKEGKRLVVIPIAFVSDHSETLVELDIDYRNLALDHGAKAYCRVPALQVHTTFIEALVDLVKK